MENLINDIQEKLNGLSDLNYIDEDWGQLDYYSPNFPVQWPCALIDINSADFDDIGKDNKATPINRQTAEIMISVTVANLRTTNSSGYAPINQKNHAGSIHTIIKRIHEKLHGVHANETSGKLMRKKMQRIKRDDGVQEYTIQYSLSLANT